MNNTMEIVIPLNTPFTVQVIWIESDKRINESEYKQSIALLFMRRFDFCN